MEMFGCFFFALIRDLDLSDISVVFVLCPSATGCNIAFKTGFDFDFFGGGTLAGGDLILITLPSPSEFPLYLPSPTEVDGILTTGDFESPGT